MIVKNIHHHLMILMYLIITFSTFTICIQNVNLMEHQNHEDDGDNHHNHYDRSESAIENDWIPITMPMGRQRGGNYYEDNTINAGEDISNNVGRGSFAFPTNDSPYPFDNPNTNTNKKNVRPLQPPQQNYNQDNYYSYHPYPPQQQQQQQLQQQQYQTQQQQQYQQTFNSNLNSDLPNVPGYDNYRKTTYQQNYPNYAQNHEIYLNNYQRPNYYRPQSPPPLSSYPPQQRPNPPDRPPPPSYFGGNGGGRPPTSTSQYAGQFSNFLGPLGSLLGMGGSPSPSSPSSSVSANVILQGLEKISRNDDLECVPKVLCQMVGNPQRRMQLPSYVTSPGLQALISALPASSPALIYGRAALLGITGGERTCSTTYSKCPKEEEEILYYLNNHRGGFFKFFNEPGGSPYRPSTTSTTESPLGIFMNFLGGNTDSSSNNNGNTLGAFIGNILHGLAGGTSMYTGRSRSRRDAERRIMTNVKENEHTNVEEDSPKMIISLPEEDKGQPEGRILNNKVKIKAFEEVKPSNFVKFPYEEDEGLRYGRLYDPYQEINDETTYHQGTNEVFKFSQDHRYAKQFLYDGSYPEQSGSKVVFPKHEENGNHRVRFGKILNRPNYNMNNYHSNDANNYNNYYNRRPYYSRRDYGTGTSDYRPPATRYQPTDRPDDGSQYEGNIYVTNSQGVVEYYVNKQGKKVYL